MKKYIVISLCLCIALVLPVFAEVNPDAYWYPMEDGTMSYDQEAYEHDLAVDMVETSGVDLDPELYWKIDENATIEMMYYFDFEAFKNDYDALTYVPEPENAPDPTPVLWPDEVIEDEVMPDLSDLNNSMEMEEPDTELELGNNSSMVYTLNDLRYPVVDDISLEEGMKSLIRSIFGEYQPNMTTMAVTETVDGETVTTLIDVVASGSAGIDFEYISGVALFALMLFCMFKLLGGILT